VAIRTARQPGLADCLLGLQSSADCSPRVVRSPRPLSASAISISSSSSSNCRISDADATATNALSTSSPERHVPSSDGNRLLHFRAAKLLPQRMRTRGFVLAPCTRDTAHHRSLLSERKYYIGVIIFIRHKSAQGVELTNRKHAFGLPVTFNFDL